MPLQDWLSLQSLGWSLLRIAWLWLGLHAAGTLVGRIGPVSNHLGRMPRAVLGMLANACLLLILSWLGVMYRGVIAPILVVEGLAGIILIYMKLRRMRPKLKLGRTDLLLLPFLALGTFLLLTNLMFAARPDLYLDDPHVTYIVQPDRWLNEGGMHFLDEMVFSGLPMVNEMLLLMPSSLSIDRIDQLILGQLFEMSLLLATIIYGMSILKLSWRWFPAISIALGGCYQLVLWGHVAKPDMAAVFFATLAFTLLIRSWLKRGRATVTDASAFLLLGLALGTKQTAYLLILPFGVLATRIARRESWRLTRIAAYALVLVSIPLLFAVRTAAYTGSPFYPHMSVRPLLKEEWTRPDLEIEFLQSLDRSSEQYPDVTPLEDFGRYLLFWGASLYIFLAGLAAAWKHISPKIALASIAVLSLYVLQVSMVFRPLWWSGKYGILLIPAAALVGSHFLSRWRFGIQTASLLALVTLLVYGTFREPVTEHYTLAYRWELLQSYAGGEWRCEDQEKGTLMEHLPAVMWMNHNLPEGSRILCFRARHRYLSDHELVVVERHPLTARLFLQNSAAAEIELMEKAGIDYLLIRPQDPFFFDDERFLAFLPLLPDGELFRPRAEIGGYRIYELLGR